MARTELHEPLAGGLLLHPVAVLSVVVLLVNDHILKDAAPGLLTGKLSDVAGLIAFPLLLAEVAALLARRTLRRTIEAGSIVPAAVFITAAGFCAVKTTDVAATLWAAGLGALQWLVGFGWARAVPPHTVAAPADPTDLIALPALLAALLIAQRRRSRPNRAVEGGTTVSRFRLPINRLIGVAMAVITGLSSIATQPGSAPVVSLIKEHFQLDASFVVARHVAWTVTQLDSDRFRELALTATVGRALSPDNMCPGATVPGIELRVVPDDPGLAAPVQKPRGCEPAGIDLTDACASGCTGGATILVEFAFHKDFAAKNTDVFTSLGAKVYGDPHGSLELVADPWPAQDVPAAVETTGLLAYPFDVGPGSPSAELHAILRVPAAALEGPLAGLHGRLRVLFWNVDVKAGFGTDQSLTVGTLEPYEPDSVMGGAQVEIDWLRQCSPGKDCEIPLTLDVRTPRSGPNAPSFDPQTRQDFYRWGLEVTLIALDGRSLPSGALQIEGPSDPIRP